ncbi:MAG: asparagine synthetase B family protein, partial [Anaerolineales bacterium]
MSGIFGIVDSKSTCNIRDITDRMSLSMSHRDWFVAESFLDEAKNVGLGRIGIGIFNKDPQPVWNASRTVALVLAGEFYNKSSESQSDEQYALALYESKGKEFAAQLNGAFVVGIYDKSRNLVLIANDRFGLYPLYYAVHNGRLVFAPEMKGILCDPGFSKKLDLTALAQYVRFQHLLGERTFLEDIQLLPGASILSFDLSSGSCAITPYWSFDCVPDRPDISFNEAVEEAGSLFRRTVQRLSGDAYRPGVYLSGGLDARAILGMIERRPVASLTYGARNCRDVYYASRIAKVVGSDHHWVDLPNGEWVKDYADFHLELTEGFHSWIHAHGMSTLSQARELMDVNLTGWDGGTVMAYPESPEFFHFKAVDDQALVADLFSKFNQRFTWPSITEGEERLLYSEAMGKQLHGLAFESFRSELSKYLGYRADVRGQYFFLRNHCTRLTQNFTIFTRSHVEVRFPFFDYDLFNFIYSLPTQMLTYRRLYREVIQREMSKLAYIPYDHDEFLPTTQSLVRGIHAAAVNMKYRINRHLWEIFPEMDTLY